MPREPFAYIPKTAREELDSIMNDKKIFKKADAWREMAKYARVGREIEKIKERLLLQDIIKKKR